MYLVNVWLAPCRNTSSISLVMCSFDCQFLFGVFESTGNKLPRLSSAMSSLTSRDTFCDECSCRSSSVRSTFVKFADLSTSIIFWPFTKVKFRGVITAVRVNRYRVMERFWRDGSLVIQEFFLHTPKLVSGVCEYRGC